MAKGKKRAVNENEDEYKTANARFKNPFHKTRNCTLTSASAESMQLETVQKSRTIAYNPPTRSVLVDLPPPPPDMPDPPDPSSPDSKKKTQVSVAINSHIRYLIGFSLQFLWTSLERILTRSRMLSSPSSTTIRLAAHVLAVWLVRHGLAVVLTASNLLSCASVVLS